MIGPRNSCTKSSGFTIVELLIVIVVIGILAAIVIVAYSGIQDRANNTAVQADITGNAKVMEQYKVLNGTYPVDRAQFRSAGLNFTLDSYRHAVYCQDGGSSDPRYAFVLWSTGGEAYTYTPSGGRQAYTDVADNSVNICNRAGLVDADTTVWLRGSGNWGAWVVY